MPRVYRLLIACPDRVGIVARVSSFIADRNGSILESDYHSDPVEDWFFMRNEIDASTLSVDVEQFRTEFEEIANEFGMEWRLSDSSQVARVAILASRDSHCLADLLHREHSGDLAFETVCVVSNHDKLRDVASWYEKPYHHVPVDKKNRAAHFEEVFRLVDEAKVDLVVLARYMQIIPDTYCSSQAGRMINIHHSFLPSFSGARPYHQAYQRGVKLIGATCHYVTADLDEGPIIEQEVVRVSHRHSIADLQRLGRDVERASLARGVRYHLEDRVIIRGNRTIVFS